MTATLSAVGELELVGRAELMRILNVSKTRFAQIVSQKHKDDPRRDFPAPVADLQGGKIWNMPDVRPWADYVGRTLNDLAAPWSEPRRPNAR